MRIFLYLPLLLSTEYWALTTASARDFGVQGRIALIEEEDPLQLIQNKLKVMKERGELEHHSRALQKKTIAAVERPKPVEGITRTAKPRGFYYGSTYVVNADLTDHQGRIFIKKGTKVNPLETVTLSQSLLFLGGDDEEQKNFAKEALQQGPLTLILTKGAPLALSEELKKRVYFDRGGILTEKLGIKNVPALVTQEGKKLRIEEVYPLQPSPLNMAEGPESQSKFSGSSQKVPSDKVLPQRASAKKLLSEKVPFGKISPQKISVQKAQPQIKGS